MSTSTRVRHLHAATWTLLALSIVIPQALAATGGPDAFGYTWDDGVPFQRVDIDGTGTLLGNGDDVGFDVNLGAPFEFYGVVYPALRVCSNGYISTALGSSGGDLSNDCPLPATPSTGSGARIYPLHDDLDLNAGTGTLWYQYFPLCPRPADRSPCQQGCSIIQWNEVEHWSTSNPWDIWVYLYDSGDLTAMVGAGNPELGSGSTTGIQNVGATTGLTVACNTPGSIPDDYAVSFYHPNPTLPVLSGLATDACLTLQEDFEAAWPAAGWFEAAPGINPSQTGAAAAHDGALGYIGDESWDQNPRIQTGMPGTRLSAWVYNDSAVGQGRAYLGFDGDPTGCKTLVFGANSQDIHFQDNSGFNFSTVAAQPTTIASDRWYRLEVEFVDACGVTGRLFDSDGVTELAAVSHEFLEGAGLGALTLRSFGGAYFDTVEIAGPPLIGGFDDSMALWPSSGWTLIDPIYGPQPPGSIDSLFAHDGEFGYSGQGKFALKDALSFGLPGEIISIWAQVGAGSRTYLCFDASPAGCKSLVLADDTSDIRFQDNPAFGFTELNATPFDPSPGVWYRMEIEVLGANDVQGRLYAEDGVTLLAAVAQNYPGGIVGGQTGMRSYGGGMLDTLEDFSPTPFANCAGCAICGDCDSSGALPVTILDALVGAQFSAGIGIPSAEQLLCCDVNDSGTLEILDALLMAQTSAGLPVVLMCP